MKSLIRSSNSSTFFEVFRIFKLSFVLKKPWLYFHCHYFSFSFKICLFLKIISASLILACLFLNMCKTFLELLYLLCTLELVSTLFVNFALRRHMGYFVINIYIPCSLLVAISWVGFWINREATSDRITLGMWVSTATQLLHLYHHLSLRTFIALTSHIVSTQSINSKIFIYSRMRIGKNMYL